MVDIMSMTLDECRAHWHKLLAPPPREPPTREQTDADLIRATAARLEMDTIIDANQAWHRAQLARVQAELEAVRAEIIEADARLAMRIPGTIRELNKTIKTGIARIERLNATIAHHKHLSTDRMACLNDGMR